MKELTPQKLQDIIFQIDDFLTIFRNTDNDKVLSLVEHLELYIKNYFSSTDLDTTNLKQIGGEIADEMYQKIASFSIRDIHTDGYFGVLINRLFWELSQKGVHCFFILDNKLRDDRFKMTVELFKTAGFKVICPYNTENLEYSESYSPLEIKDYQEIEKEIDEATELKQHILYIEKDESVNYIKKVLYQAEEVQNEYVCIYRNKAPNENLPATRLLGSFGDIID